MAISVEQSTTSFFVKLTVSDSDLVVIGVEGIVDFIDVRYFSELKHVVIESSCHKFFTGA